VREARKLGPVELRSAALGLLCALVAGLLVLGPLEPWELRTYDLRFRLRGPRPTRARIVIAAIQDSTLAAWPEPKLFWGSHFAAGIAAARDDYGASWIGLDYIPSVSVARWEPDREHDFAVALSGGQVVLACALYGGAGPQYPALPLLYASPDQSTNLGAVDARSEPDNVLRRLALFHPFPNGLVPSLPAALALRLRGRVPNESVALHALAVATGAAAERGELWINYVGPPPSNGQSAFPYLPFEQLAQHQLTGQQREQIRDAVVLVGFTHRGFNDVVRGPEGDYNGVEVLAHELATLVDGRPLRRAPRAQEAALSIALGAAVAALGAFLPVSGSLALAALAAGAWAGLAIHAFRSDALWPLAGPLAAIGLGWIGQTGARAVAEADRRRRLLGLFGRYVSTEVVAHLLQHPAHLELGGEEREVSVLFVDIRGHTTASERRAPAVVLQELNAFFGQVVPVIDQYGGLVLNYEGDGLLAVFGAPRSLPNHAQAAVEAALAIVRVNRRRRADPDSPAGARVRIGCGINSGLAVCGNLGEAARSQYSIVGDTVNVASRLQELNKLPELNTEFPSEVVMSAATFGALERQPPARGPFEFAIRGREGAVCVYQARIDDDEMGVP
jgi:adenylate cyclase